jgi:hypothetical protein
MRNFFIWRSKGNSSRFIQKAVHKTFLLGFGQTKLAADAHLQIVIGHVGALHDNLIADHYRRGYRQVEFEIFIRFVFRLRLCGDIDFNRIFFAQPGHNLLKMFSGFAVWFIQKEADFEHD